jgi:2-polyprenyl-3-methyl-5-hydroxy-6-metoxy-1,4-benzoquinol methylase
MKINSNESAQRLWNIKAVGEQRAKAKKGSCEYFREIRQYRYGYETPWISRLFNFSQLHGKEVLEIGVGNGIDAVEMARCGARYTGLDVTEGHLSLTGKNFQCNGISPSRLIHGDLLESVLDSKFDVIYSFGVLHHIQHEEAYLRRLTTHLKPEGELRIAVYSRYSFFNFYLLTSWILKNRIQNSLDDWRSHVAEGSQLGTPVIIKIRSKRQAESLLKQCGFEVKRYWKRGFVQNYIPFLGKKLHPDGSVLNALGAMLGWYHVFHCRVKQ